MPSQHERSKQLAALAGSLEEMLGGANNALKDSEEARLALESQVEEMRTDNERNMGVIGMLQRREEELQALIQHAEAELDAVLLWLQAEGQGEILEERLATAPWNIGVMMSDGTQSRVGGLLGEVERAMLAKVRQVEARRDDAKRRVDELEKEAEEQKKKVEELNAISTQLKQQRKDIEKGLLFKEASLQVQSN